MKELDILIPFGVPPAEMSADLLKELKLPALATLISRTTSDKANPRNEKFEDFSRALPHEVWLTRQFGLTGDGKDNTSPPVATALMQSFGLESADGTWFVLQPVHIHIARDHLVLTNPKQLELPEQEARPLFDVAQPLFEEYGKELIYGDASTWFVRADDWSTLQTSSPDAAGGHNIDIWMPKGQGERDWRKVQNEVQMHWFDHPVNAEREARRLKPVNSIWLWGGAAPKAPVQTKYAQAFNLRGWMTAFGQLTAQHERTATAEDIVKTLSGSGLLMLDDLLAPALSNDWGRWLEGMRGLEVAWFAPLLNALKTGAIDRISITATNDIQISRFAASRGSLRKFWIKPGLATLCP